jgi:hypothetical protein
VVEQVPRAGFLRGLHVNIVLNEDRERLIGPDRHVIREQSCA